MRGPTVVLREDSPRAADWRHVFGSLSVLVKSTSARPSLLPDGRVGMVYDVDIPRLAPEVIERAVTFIAERFGLPIDTVRTGVLGNHGIHLLAEDIEYVVDTSREDHVSHPPPRGIVPLSALGFPSPNPRGVAEHAQNAQENNRGTYLHGQDFDAVARAVRDYEWTSAFVDEPSTPDVVTKAAMEMFSAKVRGQGAQPSLRALRCVLIPVESKPDLAPHAKCRPGVPFCERTGDAGAPFAGNTGPRKHGGPERCPKPCGDCWDGAHHFGEGGIIMLSDPKDDGLLDEDELAEEQERRQHPAAMAGLTIWFECYHCDAWAAYDVDDTPADDEDGGDGCLACGVENDCECEDGPPDSEDLGDDSANENPFELIVIDDVKTEARILAERCVLTARARSLLPSLGAFEVMAMAAAWEDVIAAWPEAVAAEVRAWVEREPAPGVTVIAPLAIRALTDQARGKGGG